MKIDKCNTIVDIYSTLKMQEYTIVLVGNEGAGKSSLLEEALERLTNVVVDEGTYIFEVDDVKLTVIETREMIDDPTDVDAYIVKVVDYYSLDEYTIKPTSKPMIMCGRSVIGRQNTAYICSTSHKYTNRYERNIFMLASDEIIAYMANLLKYIQLDKYKQFELFTKGIYRIGKSHGEDDIDKTSLINYVYKDEIICEELLTLRVKHICYRRTFYGTYGQNSYKCLEILKSYDFSDMLKPHLTEELLNIILEGPVYPYYKKHGYDNLIKNTYATVNENKIKEVELKVKISKLADEFYSLYETHEDMLEFIIPREMMLKKSPDAIEKMINTSKTIFG